MHVSLVVRMFWLLSLRMALSGALQPPNLAASLHACATLLGCYVLGHEQPAIGLSSTGAWM